MKKFTTKIILFLFVLMFLPLTVNSAGFSSSIDKLVKGSSLDKTATIAVSVKNAKSGKSIYEYNEGKLLHPASTLKIFTLPVAIDALGKDYTFKTQLYIDKNNNLYIKLGADPLLSSSDLNNLVKKIKLGGGKTVKRIYIDDTIVDNVEWGVGWMWDDDTNCYMPKFSAYNLDGNVFKVDVAKNPSGSYTTAKSTGMYSFSVLNKTKIGEKNNVSINRYNWMSPDLIEVTGTINSNQSIKVPINNMRRYFITRLTEYLTYEGIKYDASSFTSMMVPSDATFIAEVIHSMDSVVSEILKNSDNKACESILKIAAGKTYSSTGTQTLVTQMIDAYYNRNKLDTKSILLADSSGVSRNNLISTDWMTSALSRIYNTSDFEYIQNNMAQPGEGTMRNRLFDLRGNLWLKTGTISNISGITGYVKAKNGEVYTVAILIQNFKDSQSSIKQLEDSIITAIYSQ